MSAARALAGVIGVAMLIGGFRPSLSAQGTASAAAPGSAPASVPAARPRTGADSILDARVARVASGLRCPVCQGLSIQDSPSELAQDMRNLVRDQLAAGRTDQEVRDYFVSKYGEFILLEPKPSGFNLLAYALPALALVAGALVILRGVKKWTAVPADGAAD